MDIKIDVIVDLSSCDKEDAQQRMNAIESINGLGDLAGEITYIVPPSLDWDKAGNPQRRRSRAADAIESSIQAMQRTGRVGRHIMFLFGGAVPGNEAVSVLIGVLEGDPMFGFALPRIASAEGQGVAKVSNDLGDPAIDFVPRRVLGELPEFYIVPECLGPCMVVRNTLLANLAPLETSLTTLQGAVLEYLCRARRIGYRGVIVNRAVVSGGPPELQPRFMPDPVDVWKILRVHHDLSRSRNEMNRQALHSLESFLSRAAASSGSLKNTILIDGRGMGDCFNGTSHCILGLADGLSKFRHSWNVTLVVTPEAAVFHNLSKRYPDWSINHDISSCRATAAIRMSQPWHISTMIELHRQALFNFYLVLDTIAWDTIADAPESLDATWRFLSKHADGLLYISRFSGERFETRFPLAPSVREHIMYLSFHPGDYVNAVAQRAHNEEAYILVIGNKYDHKNLAATVDTLAGCFPFQTIKAVGLERSEHFHVEALPSGKIAEEEMDRLYAHARLIVFPSYYEGFGFPVIRGLSYNRTVLARRSDLLAELADNYSGPGRLVAFTNPLEMMELAGQILHGEDLQPLALGRAVAPGAEPLNWAAIGQGLLEFVAGCAAIPSGAKWLEREEAIQQILAFHGR
jgi:glycosyltransferase involved in cell wall biosynthesis